MATLTKAMIDDLHKGMASLSLLAYPTGGVTFSNLNFEKADQIFTLKDSFSITPSDPTSEEIKIDQKDQTIDTTTETGEYKMAGQIPSVATALLDYFMTKAKTVSGIKGQDGDTYEGSSYYTEPKEVIATVLVESASKKTAIVFARLSSLFLVFLWRTHQHLHTLHSMQTFLLTQQLARETSLFSRRLLLHKESVIKTNQGDWA
jgi:hypothetical protein